MKIDIHAHTKSTKSGDAVTRNISPDKFVDIIKDTEVKIIGITNHNHFDEKQYLEMVKLASNDFQVWPGVELDVVEDGRRGHMLVLVNPINYHQLYLRMKQLLKGTTEEKFEINLKELVNNFESLDSIFIPHYIVKKPNITDEEVSEMMKLMQNEKRLIKEATNSISAGIYVSHGHKSIYGSDVHDWDEYKEKSNDLPDLRLPVASYEQFCLLLEKDESTINTILDVKKHEEITVKPFKDDSKITFKIFNDINILFGSKGTGKTEILKAIQSKYNSKGMKTLVFESNRENLDDYYDLKGKKLSFSIAELGLESCSKEIEELKNAYEESISSISSYAKYYSNEITNKRAKSIVIKDLDQDDCNVHKRNFKSINDAADMTSKFIDFVQNDKYLNEVIDKDLINELIEVVEKFNISVNSERENGFYKLKTSEMFNLFIKTINSEISRKTGKPSKPSDTGFKKYALNRIKLEKNVNKLISNIQSEVITRKEFVGDLDQKGMLQCLTESMVHDGQIANSKFFPLKKVKKTPQKEFVNCIYKIKEALYTYNLFESISELNSIPDIDSILDIDDIVLCRKYFAIEEIEYVPSNGESSMLLLYKELNEEKEVYLLDEPEKSLGNDYINDVIVPLLKAKARMGKRVIIATHDANIAVRTLPYNSIYRRHDTNRYSTFIGNPFTNFLVDVGDINGKLDWKEISMKTLEGGKEAFGERGKIYGN